ncbi:hypothetical protein [Phenylobacterium hankyongense]|uniref:hypothetical protein n=1 Tax=Phenylobacterium hankyongense TaxID=1813876 RepID=UPI001057A9B9|nr:hypothetical protein [Phenylobacterium hankyongense]
MPAPPPEADELFDLYRECEHVLKRAGLIDPSRKRASVDWEAFARQLGDEFFHEMAASGEVGTLIAEPPRILMRDSLTFEPPVPAPITDVVGLLVRGVCQVRHNYAHGEKFIGEGDFQRDTALVRQALFVLTRAAERHEAFSAPPGASRETHIRPA